MTDTPEQDNPDRLAESELVIPPAEPRCPDCSVCGQETEFEDGNFICPECRIGWNADRFHLEPGFRLDDDLPQCPAEITPYAGTRFVSIQDHRYRCVRNEGHDSEHAGVRVDDSKGFDSSHRWRNERPDPTSALPATPDRGGE